MDGETPTRITMKTALAQIDLNSIQDLESARRAVVMLLNLVEEMQATARELQVENQRLRDENNPTERRAG